MKPLSLYIHIPFCETKCHYCAFSSFAMKSDIYPQYLESLQNEIKIFLPQYLSQYNIVSIFFGGGTPSLLTAEQIESILYTIDQIMPIQDIEICIEAQPNTLSYEKANTYKAAGINRLSIGVQSFQDKDLPFINRNYNQLQVREVLEHACSIFDDISIDLIFGLPHQSIKDWQDNIRQALNFPLSHISMYELMFEPGTYFTKTQSKLTLPSEDEILEMYQYNEEIMPKYQFIHYEIANWYRKKPCFHNQLFWQGNDYLGFGLSAESYINGVSYIQTKNLKTYISHPISNRSSIKRSNEQKMLLYVNNRLRLLKEGLSTQDLRKHFHKNEQNAIIQALESQNKYIKKQGYRYILKQDYITLLDSIIENIVYFLENHKTYQIDKRGSDAKLGNNRLMHSSEKILPKSINNGII